jgi:hypothetical protein
MKLILIYIITIFSLSSFATDVPVNIGNRMLGTGYYSAKQTFSGDCVATAGSTILQGGDKAASDLKLVTEKSHILNSLGLNTGFSARYGAAKISNSSTFLQSTESDDYSITYTFISPIIAKSRIYDTSTGRPDIVSKFQNTLQHDPANFLKSCGDEYISEVKYGATLAANVRISFNSKKAKEDFSNKFKVSGKTADFSFELTKAHDESHINSEITVTLFQSGGNVTQLNRALVPKAQSTVEGDGKVQVQGNSGVAIVSCSMGDFASCSKVIERVIEYSGEDFSNQLKTNDKETGSLAVIGYRTSPYSDLGVYDYSSPVSKRMLAARESLDKYYDDVYSLYSRSKNFLDSKLVTISPRQRLAITEFSNKTNDYLDTIIKEQPVCYGDIYADEDSGNLKVRIKKKNIESSVAECIAAVNAMSKPYADLVKEGKTILDPQPEMFIQYCENAYSYSPNSRIKKAMDKILEYVKAHDLSSIEAANNQRANLEQPNKDILDANKDKFDPLKFCSVADQYLHQVKEIDFTNMNLDSLEYIQDLDQLEKINLKHNQIKDINYLKGFNALKEINLHGNMVRDISIFATLPNLEKIYLSNNNILIADYTPLNQMPRLSLIDLRNNSGKENVCAKYLVGLKDKGINCLDESLQSKYFFQKYSFDRTSMYLKNSNATKLPDGTALITVGYKAEILDIKNNRQIALPNMNRSHIDHTVTVIDDNYVLIAGGTEESSLEIYDIHAKSFTLLPFHMSTPRSGHTASKFSDGTILLAGGWVGQYWNSQPSYSAELFVLNPKDIKNSKLVDVRPDGIQLGMSVPRAWHTATVVKSQSTEYVVMIGGYDSEQSVRTIEIYDASDKLFHLLPSILVEGRGAHTATLLPDNKILVVGGFISDGKATNSAEIFDLSTYDVSTVVEPLYSARAFHTATLLKDNKILIAGGITALNLSIDDDSKNCEQCLNSAELYNIKDKAFMELDEKMAMKRARHQVIKSTENQYLFIGGNDVLSGSIPENFNILDEVDKRKN